MKILICPLDWGIGHATRCVPVIQKFIELGDEVVIVADGRPYEFLRIEFPGCRIIRLRGIKITYTKRTDLLIKIMTLIPAFIRGYYREHKDLDHLIKLERPDIIISDNRYGLWNKKLYSILITHQLNIMIPRSLRVLSPFINRFIYHWIERFNECWIPDFELHKGLAGSLSHPEVLPKNSHYIGTLSRFSNLTTKWEMPQIIDYDIVVSLSGPEPQRTIFEEKIFEQVKGTGLSGIILRGFTEKKEEWDLTDKIRVYSHLETSKIREIMRRTHLVICRSGYSSLMDLVTMGINAILVPTPGQTEQEYLARYLLEKKIYFSMSQEHFDLLYAIEMSRNFHGFVLQNDYKALSERISEIKARISTLRDEL